jgi:hypothetical protein
MDVEFRWLERRRTTGFKDHEGKWDTVTGYMADRVLQFRTRIMTMGNGYRQAGAGDGNTFVAYERPMGWTWGEWQDVPVEVVNV